MKRTSWVVAVRRDGAWSDMEYVCTYACSAQEAVDWARYELCVYEVCTCFKQVNNWN